MLLPQYCCIISTTYIFCRVVLENRHVPNLNHFGTVFPLFDPAFSRLSFTCSAGADVVWSVCSAWLVWTLFGLTVVSVSISCVNEHDDDLANRTIRYLLVNKIQGHKTSVLMSVVLIWVYTYTGQAKNMLNLGVNQTHDPWNTSSMLSQLSHVARLAFACDTLEPNTVP